MRVLIVDDDEISLELLENTLRRAGYDVLVARNGPDALEQLASSSCRLVISDWEMPAMSGIELCRRIRERNFPTYVYIILVTARTRTHDVVEGMDAGADDFITKPFEPAELCVRLRAGERILGLEGRDLTIFALARLAESRDPETGAHLERIREYCRILAQHLATVEQFRHVVNADYVQMIYRTSPLHDIGKVGIPDGVLLKPGRLTDREFEVMKAHTVIGAETLQAAVHAHPEAEFLRMACDIALTHHEQFDGSGYPAGLVGEQIPLCGRIVALADVYDALTVRRVYKAAFTHEVARSIILDGRGTHFDPDIVDAFVANEAQFLAIRHQFTDNEPAPAPLLTPTTEAHGRAAAPGLRRLPA
jgi:putative two-component system response regulator